MARSISPRIVPVALAAWTSTALPLLAPMSGSLLLISDPKLMLLDEPVAGMTSSEIDRTAEMLRSLSANRAILVVEHDMEFVRKIADQVTVMDQGSMIAQGDMAQIQSDKRVREVYLGDEKLSF